MKKPTVLILLEGVFISDFIHYLGINVLVPPQRDTNYEVLVVSFNAQGESPASPPLTVYVGEAVPTGKPRKVEAKPVTSTEIKISWEVGQESYNMGGRVLSDSVPTISYCFNMLLFWD